MNIPLVAQQNEVYKGQITKLTESIQDMKNELREKSLIIHRLVTKNKTFIFETGGFLEDKFKEK